MATMTNDRVYKVLATLAPWMDHRARRYLRNITLTVILIVVFIIIFGALTKAVPVVLVRVIGVLSLFLCIWLFVFLIECYYRSLRSEVRDGMFEVYCMVRAAEDTDADILRSFITSKVGTAFLLRAECDSEELDKFLSTTGALPHVPLPAYRQSLPDFVFWLYDNYPTFSALLARHSVARQDVGAIVLWLLAEQAIAMESERWWHKEPRREYKILENEHNSFTLLRRHLFEVEEEHAIIYSFVAVRSIWEIASNPNTHELDMAAAEELVASLVNDAERRGSSFVFCADVLRLVNGSTTRPTNQGDVRNVGGGLQLREKLGKSIIGQPEALANIAQILANDRTSGSNHKGPRASFLFLGPPGVGKAETAHGIASICFGNSDAIIEFDMVNYRDEAALNRLQGSSELNTSGALSAALRAHPYGVLLLRNIDGGSAAVQDFIARLLRGGVFTDSAGIQGCIGSMIVVATSHAGSDIILKLQQQQVNLDLKKELIMSAVTERKLIEPSLLHSFDSTVIFHPLTEQSLSKVAKLRLSQLDARLQRKGIRVNFSGNLLDRVLLASAEEGRGAHSVLNYIRRYVEPVIANRIIGSRAGHTL